MRRLQRCLASAGPASTSLQAPSGCGSTSNNTMPITKSSPARTATPSYRRETSISLPIATRHGDNFSGAPHATAKISSSSFFAGRLPLPAASVRPLSILFLLRLLVLLPMLPALRQPPAPAPAPASPTLVGLTHAPSATTSATLQSNSSATTSSSNKASRHANGNATTSCTACSSVQKLLSTGEP